MASSNQKPTLGARIVRASIIVAVAHLLFKAAGILLAIVMARNVEPNVYGAVYTVAFEASELWGEAQGRQERVYLNLWERYLERS